jgi:glycerol-3-phosphate O-acyltransferase
MAPPATAGEAWAMDGSARTRQVAGATVVEPAAPISTLFLSFAETPAEESMLRGWLGQHARPGAAHVGAGAGELEALLDRGANGDLEVVPVRVAWLAPARRGERRARLRDVLLLNDPRRPRRSSQERIARQDPDRYRVITGEPARLGELRRRFEAHGGDEAFGTWVERQGALALERAEREVLGARYKVPRLVHEDVMASRGLRDTVARQARQLGREPDEVHAEAAAALEEMVASQSRLAIDAWDHFGHWLARAYTVDVDTSRLQELHVLNRSHALVFLPSHRSYLDPSSCGRCSRSTASRPTTRWAARTSTSGRSGRSPGATATCSSGAR